MKTLIKKKTITQKVHAFSITTVLISAILSSPLLFLFTEAAVSKLIGVDLLPVSGSAGHSVLLFVLVSWVALPIFVIGGILYLLTKKSSQQKLFTQTNTVIFLLASFIMTAWFLGL